MTNVLDAEVQALRAEQIADDIEALENTKAPLWAVYGPGGTYDDERSSLVSVIEDELRLSSHAAGQSITEAACKARARADRRVLELVQRAREERTTLALIDAQINNRTRRYELAQGRMNTARKLIRFDGSNGA